MGRVLTPLSKDRGDFRVFSFGSCFHFPAHFLSGNARFFFLFGSSAKRQNLAALPAQCGRQCHFQLRKLILQPPPKASSGDMVTSLLNYSDWFKNRVQGFPCQESCQPAHFLAAFSISLCWYTSKHFFFLIFILKVFYLSFLEPRNYQKRLRGPFRNDSIS